MYEMHTRRIEFALEKVCRLVGITFRRSDEEWKATAGIAVGDVKTVMPDALSTNGHGDSEVNYGAIVGLLVEAVKEQQQQIAALRAEVDKRKTLGLPKK